MKQTLIIFTVFILGLTSCSNVYFNTPLPIDAENLESVPADLQGYWGENNDSFEINDQVAMLIEHKTKTVDTLIWGLSDSLVLRQADNFYIVNLKNDDWWEGIIFKKKGDEIEVYYPNYKETIQSQKLELKNLKKEKYTEEYFYSAQLKKKDIKKFVKKHCNKFYTLKADSTLIKHP